jgi:hypothetical protein
MPRRSIGKHYINNEELFKVMSKFIRETKTSIKNKKQLPQIPNYVGECFIMICNRLSNRPNFNNYTYKDEMISDAIENCVMAAHGFNPRKSRNPFAYFTQIAWNAFIRRIDKEKKQQYVKHKNFENDNLINEIIGELDQNQQTQSILSSDVIKSFEDKLKIKKRK